MSSDVIPLEKPEDIVYNARHLADIEEDSYCVEYHYYEEAYRRVKNLEEVISMLRWGGSL